MSLISAGSISLDSTFKSAEKILQILFKKNIRSANRKSRNYYIWERSVNLTNFPQQLQICNLRKLLRTAYLCLLILRMTWPGKLTNCQTVTGKYLAWLSKAGRLSCGSPCTEAPTSIFARNVNYLPRIEVGLRRIRKLFKFSLFRSLWAATLPFGF